jgi:hypothetical protein
MSELLWRGVTPMKSLEVFSLKRVHGGLCLWVVMVITKHVQNSVHQQQGKFVINGSCMTWSLCNCHTRANNDITKQQR